MASSSLAIPSAPLFTGENYDFWCIKMKALLTALDVWEIVEQGCILPEPLTGQQLTTEQQSLVKEKTTKNAKATAYLHSSIGETIFPRIINTTSAKELWDTLQEDFHGLEKGRAIKLQIFEENLRT